MCSLRSYFPSLQGKSEVYLDSAATTHKVSEALEAMSHYYNDYNANVHRGAYLSAQQATNAYESARKVMAEFVGANDAREIVFTSGATESLNIVASGLRREHLQGSKILVCISEHHANLLPWQVLAKRLKLEMQAIHVSADGTFDQECLENALTSIDQDLALLAIAHVSNVLGNIYPIQTLCAKAKAMQAISVIDGTQAAAHIHIDVQDIDCDFYALSGHKMYAATGIGILYGKSERLEQLDVSKYGGEMIKHVSWHELEMQQAPLKFEAGTPNISGALSIAAAASFIRKHYSQIKEQENRLYSYLLKGLQTFIDDKKIRLIGNNANDSICVLSFYSEQHHANDIASFLSSLNIAVRSGHHCAMPLMDALHLNASLRISLACYTQYSDIDTLIEALQAFFYKATQIENDLDINEEQIRQAKSWTEKHRLLLLGSRQLPLLHEQYRTTHSEIHGCEANVWIATSDSGHENVYTLQGYSNSKIVRGLLALLLNKVNRHLSSDSHSDLGNNEQEIIENLREYFIYLGLDKYFSQGRRDGMNQIFLRLSELISLKKTR